MTEEAKPPVLTARRAPQHIRLFEADDAYKRLCILTNATKPSPVSALCWQIHRFLAVTMLPSRVWVHCPRASNGLLPRRSYLIGYAQWDARFDLYLLMYVKQSYPAAVRSKLKRPLFVAHDMSGFKS